MMGDYNFWEKCWNKENIETMLPYLEKYNNIKSDEIKRFQKDNITTVCDAA